MKRLSGQARYRLLVGLLVIILVYYAYKTLTDYNNRIIHEVSQSALFISVLN